MIDSEPTEEQLKAYHLHVVEGLTLRVVADELHVSSPQTVKNWCDVVSRFYRHELRATAESRRADLTKRLNGIYSKALAAFEESRKDAVTFVEKEAADEVDNYTTTKRTKQVGEPAFLRIAINAIDQERQLWWGEIQNSERNTEGRIAGLSREEQLDKHINHLNEIRNRLRNKRPASTQPALPGGGEGNRP